MTTLGHLNPDLIDPRYHSQPGTARYQLDPETEAAAETWKIVFDERQLRCGQCKSPLGLGAGYVLQHDYLKPLILAHIIRSHGYQANPVRIED